MRSVPPPSTSPCILVHEYFTGGGWPGPELPEALAGEGLAILRALLTDFREWGRFPVVTTLDRRLRGVSLPADRVVFLDGEVYPAALLELAVSCGSALIVAPETGRMLERLSASMVEAGVRLLGSLPEAVAAAADKWECHRRFEAAGLPTPRTVRATRATAVAKAEELGFPLVVKPLRGAGCEGVGLVERADALGPALDSLGFGLRDPFLLQRFVHGLPASVTLVAAGGDSVPLSLNEQWVTPGVPFVYRGGVAAISDSRRSQALELAGRAVSLVPGTQGFVGIDLILTDVGCSLIEINPRPTTSYVGVRRVVDIDLAETVWRACREGILPESAVTAGEAPFGKAGLDDR